MNEWQELGNAIVLQAVKDYKAAMRKLRKDADYKPARKMLRECERFFHSGWYEMLTDIEPECLLRGVRRKGRAV